jgi:hypothetical protein
MKQLFLLLILLSGVSIVHGQSSGGLFIGAGGGRFSDHQLFVKSLSATLRLPYVFVPEKLFIEIGGSLSFGEGNRNFAYTDETFHSISGIEITDFFRIGHMSVDIWKPERIRTSHSFQGSMELLVGKTFSIYQDKHALSISSGLHITNIGQHYILESFVVEIPPGASGWGEGPLTYYIPFSQEYTFYNFAAHGQYFYKVTQKFFLTFDVKYYHQKKPLTGNTLFFVGVGASL